jgi:sugar lactone lactonase YvrE
MARYISPIQATVEFGGVLANGTVFTFAGSGSFGLSGNGGPATAARMMSPVSVAVRASGEVFICDLGMCTVRVVLLNGTIILVAGDPTGACGFNGDSIPGIFAMLFNPVGVAVSASGDVYIADSSNNRIRKVSWVTNNISTVLGSDGSNILASSTSLSSPSQIAYSTAGLYIADTENCALRLVTPDGYIHTVVGTVGACVVSGLPYYINNFRGVAVHSNGTVYFSSASCIRYLAADNSVVTVAGSCSAPAFSGDGAAGTDARFSSNLAHLAFDASGTLFIADTGSYRVRALYTTGVVVTVFGQGRGGWNFWLDDGTAANKVSIGAPSGLAVDALGNVLVAVPDMNSIRLAALNVSVPNIAPSYSITNTPQPTHSTSRTASVSPSNSQSSSNSASSSTSASSSITASESVSSTVSVSSTMSGSSTVTVSMSVSASGSEPATASQSFTQAVSISSSTLSRTTSPSPCVSPTSSMMVSIQATFSSSPILSPSTSPSVSATPSPSPSLHALQLWFNDVNTGGLLGMSDVTDGESPVVLEIHAQYCPPPCILQCSSTNTSVVRVYPPSLQLTVGAGPDEARAELAVWAPFTTGGNQAGGTVECTSAQSRASLDVQRHNHRWPLLQDIVLLLDTGVVKSAWSSPVNVAPSLVNASIEELLSYVASAQQGQLKVPDSVSFSVSVVENTRLSLVAAPDTFNSATLVRLNGVRCNVTGVSSNGDQLLFRLPSKADLCPGVLPSADCGYLSLSITTHTDGSKGGATLSCPPFCPNDFSGSVPLSTGTANGVEVFTPALELADGLPAAIPTIRMPATGLYLTESCTADGFVDPSTGICANVSDPRHRDCGFGAGGACTTCPQHSVCPGGFRAVPLQGFYAASERTGVILECPAPNLQRCTGWDATHAAVACGNGYTAAYAGCAACAPGYYAAQDGTCEACPTQKPSVGQVLFPVLEFLGILAAACASVFGVVVTIAKVRHASLVGLPKRVLQLGVWTFSTVQLVAQVGQAAPPGLPAVILSAYAQLSVFQFRGVATPSACIPGFPFVNEISAMTIALFLTIGMLTSGVVLWKAPKPSPTWALSFRLTVLACTVMYPTVINNVLSMLDCTPTRVSGPTLFTLTGQIRDMGFDALYDLSVLSSNPTTACYVGSHTYVAAVAWCTLFLYCIAFPCCVMLMVRFRMRSVSSPAMSSKDLSTTPTAPSLTSDPLLSPFVSGDYVPSRYWFYCMDRLYIACLAIIQSVLSNTEAPVKLVLVCIVLSGAAALLCFFPPYTSQTQWKWIVKLYSLLLSLLAACVNFTASIDPGNPALLALGGIVAAGCFLLFAILIVAFFRDVYRSASMPTVPPKTCPASIADDPAWVHSNPLASSNGASGSDAKESVSVSFRKRPAAAVVILGPEFAPMGSTSESMFDSHVHNTVHRLSRNEPSNGGSSTSTARRSGFVLKPLLSRRPAAGSHRGAS